MRIGVCDDNRNDLAAMLRMLHHMAPEQAVDSFPDGRKLLAAISGGVCYDLLFLDILMPGLNGIALAREIHELVPETPVVFLTDSEAYAVEAFSVKALHYIVKPMTEPALKECLNRLAEKQSSRKRVHIVDSSGVQQMLFADEILLAQSAAHYFHLHLADGSIVKVRMTQSELQNVLGDLFLPVSRGLLVNAEFIRHFGPRSCVLKDGREILFSRKNLDAIQTAYAAYVFSQLSRRGSVSLKPGK